VTKDASASHQFGIVLSGQHHHATGVDSRVCNSNTRQQKHRQKNQTHEKSPEVSRTIPLVPTRRLWQARQVKTETLTIGGVQPFTSFPVRPSSAIRRRIHGELRSDERESISSITEGAIGSLDFRLTS
jgi:hypothetical protein